jgi:TonB family protein
MIMTMAYLLLIATLLGLAAHIGERMCAELGWPRRSAWLVALVATVALPGFSLFDGATPSAATPILSLPLLLDEIPAIEGDNGTVLAASAGASSFSWPDWQALDSTVAVVWIASSGALLLLYLVAALRLRVFMGRARTLTIDGQRVLLSDRLGPAILGFFKPRIVLPRWLGKQDTALRTQVLNHEREHIAARDQLVLLAALLLVAVMPWNVALWWQLRRLRRAIELDCDSRVLRAGAEVTDYSQALLTVGQRIHRAPFGALAMTEPMSELETRIQIMLNKAHDFSPAGFGTRFVVVVGVLALAFAVNAPKAQQAVDSPGPTATPKVFPTIRTVIYEQLNDAQICMDQDDMACTRRILNELGDRTDLNNYEAAQLQNFFAFAYFEEDDMAGAITAYETILALPQDDLPDGLISSTMRNLMILYLQVDRLQDGLALFDRWQALPWINTSGTDFHLRATILYQLERYPDAIIEMERAIAAAEEPQERWYELLYALQSTTGDSAGAANTLEILNARWPNESRPSAPDAAALGRAAVRGIWFGISDGEYQLIVKVAPIYPSQAAARGLGGYVVVSYTVTATGNTQDVEAVESSSSVFELAAIEAAQKYRYKPRVVDGRPVEVTGVTSRIEFAMSDEE